MLPNRYDSSSTLPPAIIDAFPNWVFALDEEGEEGQDESTIKPAEDQTAITPGAVCMTAADATLIDGVRVPAMIGGDWSWDGSVEAIDAIWLLTDVDQTAYTPFYKKGKDAFLAHWADKLPMRIESRLRRPDGERIRLSLSVSGIEPLS